MDIRKVKRNHFEKRSVEQFGIVKKNRNKRGHEINHFMKSENDSEIYKHFNIAQNMRTGSNVGPKYEIPGFPGDKNI